MDLSRSNTRIIVCRSWFAILTTSRSAVSNHGGEGCFGNLLAIHQRNPAEFPYHATVAVLLDVEQQFVAGNHGLAEAAAVNAHEVDQFAFESGAQRVHDQNRGGLRH